jgi:hypothetical protein
MVSIDAEFVSLQLVRPVLSFLLFATDARVCRRRQSSTRMGRRKSSGQVG